MKHPILKTQNSIKSTLLLAATWLLLIAAVTLLGGTQTAKADETPYVPKLCLWQDESHNRDALERTYKYRYGKPWDPKDTAFFYNPDSIMVDTNSAAPCGPNEWYWGRTFQIEFEKNIIPRKELYPDNRLIYYTIDDILPQYKETIEGFRKLEQKFGKFRFVDMWTIGYDTTSDFQRVLHIQFENYMFTAYAGYGYESYGLYSPNDDIEAIPLAEYSNCSEYLRGSFFELSYVEPVVISYLDISPSITSDNIIVTLPDELMLLPQEISILDTNGNLVALYRTQTITPKQMLDVSKLAAGVYFIKINNYVGKFVRGN